MVAGKWTITTRLHCSFAAHRHGGGVSADGRPFIGFSGKFSPAQDGSSLPAIPTCLGGFFSCAHGTNDALRKTMGIITASSCRRRHATRFSRSGPGDRGFQHRHRHGHNEWRRWRSWPRIEGPGLPGCTRAAVYAPKPAAVSDSFRNLAQASRFRHSRHRRSNRGHGFDPAHARGTLAHNAWNCTRLGSDHSCRSSGFSVVYSVIPLFAPGV